MSDTSNLPAGKVEKEMSFLDHLEELRWHLIRAIIAVVVVAIGVFLAKDFVFGTVVLGPTQKDFFTYRLICQTIESLCFYPEDITVFTKDLGEQFMTHIKVSIWLGLVLAFPYVFYEIWKFVKPGLYEKEQKATRGIVAICSVLFTIGVLFGYYIISPFVVTFLAGYSVTDIVANTFTLSSYIGYLTMVTIPVGIVFELPIVIYFLAKIGLVTSDFLKVYRKHAFVIILILAAIITPPDVITQLLIAAPLYMLYESGIYIAKRVEKKAEEKQ